MAERRMFAKSVIGSARFLRMPVSSRLLYYDLGMEADDDGAVEAFAVMRKTGATEDDLRVLSSKGFVRVLNDDLVTAITDWNKNNLIRKDRYHPGIYRDLVDAVCEVIITPDTQTATICQPDDNQRLTEVRLGKDSLVKSNTISSDSDDAPAPKITSFDRFWSAYPRKVGKAAAKKAFEKALKQTHDAKILISAVEAQKNSEQWKKENGRFIPNPSTWLNQGRWEDEVQAVGFANGGKRQLDEDELTAIREMVRREDQWNLSISV